MLKNKIRTARQLAMKDITHEQKGLDPNYIVTPNKFDNAQSTRLNKELNNEPEN